jgi:hypothetical protein
MVNTKMQVIVDKELAENFRLAVGQKVGVRKGAISEAFTQALKLWIKENKK